MKKILLASALTLMTVPAFAQYAPNPVGTAGNVVGTTVGTAGNVAGSTLGAAGTVASAPFQAMDGMMGGGMGSQSCVSNGAFVPCNQPMMGRQGMGQGMGMDQGMRGNRRMTRAEMRAERRAMQQQQGEM